MGTQYLKQLGQSGAYDWNNHTIDLGYLGKGGVAFNRYGKASILGIRSIVESVSGHRPKEEGKEKIVVFTSDDIVECKSYWSYLATKLVRFLIFINIGTMRIMDSNTFRFVPSVKFDSIYTDEELYSKFNLPQKYIDIIESIIK